MAPELIAAFVALGGGIALRELIPAYLKVKRGEDVATKADIAYLEQRVDTLEKTVGEARDTIGEVRDWMLYQRGRTGNGRPN